MALFSDGPISSLEDLQRHESVILEVLRTEKIDAYDKLDLTRREIALELITFLQRHGPEYLDGDRRLNHVVISDGLQQWHQAQTLASIYRDAYFRSLNDRHKEKWLQYSALTKGRKEAYVTSGIGVCRRPIARPVGITFGALPGGAADERTLLATAAYVTDGERGAPGEAVAVDLKAGELLRADCPELPAFAQGWVILCGNTAENMSQVTSVINAPAVWVEPASGLGLTLTAVPEQRPELYITTQHLLRRG